MKHANHWNVQSKEGEACGVAARSAVGGGFGLAGDMLLGLVMSLGVGLATAVLLVGMVLLMTAG